MPARVGFIAETGGFVIGIPAVLLGGWLSDMYGRWPINVWGNLAFLSMIYPVFAWIVTTGSVFAFIVGMTVLNGASNFVWGSFYAGLAEVSPRVFAAVVSALFIRPPSPPSPPSAAPRNWWSLGQVADPALLGEALR